MANLFGYISYLVLTQSYFALTHVAALFNKRAKTLVAGQQSIFLKIEQDLKQNKAPIIWFHVASLGEFEQGKPLMVALKNKLPNHKILITFFSPSGYENRHNDPAIDFAYYLPFDGPFNAKKLINLVEPKMAFWVKYDFWYHYLVQLKKEKIPVYLTSALFRNNQIYFKNYGVFNRRILTLFSKIYCQNTKTKQLLQSININNTSVTGDLRYDNVIQSAKNLHAPDSIKSFTKNSFIIVAGSSYKIEEEMLAANLMNYKNCKLIVVPHFVDSKRIEEVKQIFKEYNTACLSEFGSNKDLTNCQVLIIDKIGLLSSIYQVAQIAVIGGGFWSGGLHNILEPSVFGIPVCFGPKVSRFPEAEILVQQELATIISNTNNLKDFIDSYYDNVEAINQKKTALQEFVYQNAGATDLIIKDILA